mmetsp:Transcript_80996/g.234830  ORF Transcript_80996/g.234830 Transcript_80996/m.234830 type:complete len:391 (-) Transcript_80996:209-1381(-)
MPTALEKDCQYQGSPALAESGLMMGGLSVSLRRRSFKRTGNWNLRLLRTSLSSRHASGTPTKPRDAMGWPTLRLPSVSSQHFGKHASHMAKPRKSTRAPLFEAQKRSRCCARARRPQRPCQQRPSCCGHSYTHINGSCGVADLIGDGCPGTSWWCRAPSTACQECGHRRQTEESALDHQLVRDRVLVLHLLRCILPLLGVNGATCAMPAMTPCLKLVLGQRYRPLVPTDIARRLHAASCRLAVTRIVVWRVLAAVGARFGRHVAVSRARLRRLFLRASRGQGLHRRTQPLQLHDQGCQVTLQTWPLLVVVALQTSPALCAVLRRCPCRTRPIRCGGPAARTSAPQLPASVCKAACGTHGAKAAGGEGNATLRLLEIGFRPQLALSVSEST